ncbi:MAG: sensor histidine kinase [Microbacteriaceae bacterium]
MADSPFFRVIPRRAVLFDVGLAILVFVLCVVPLPVEIESPKALTVVLAVLSVAVRRIAPGGALALAWLTAIAQILSYERPSMAQLATLIVLGSVALVGNRFEVWAAGISALVGGAIATFYLLFTGFRFVELFAAGPLIAVLLPFAVLGSAFLVGFAIRTSASRRSEALRRAEAELEASRAVTEAQSERVRSAMARDVHDVVGHSLAVIIAQADSVEFVSDTTRVREIVATIAATARGSLVEVRSVLEQTDAAGDTEPADLDALVDQVAAAGVQVQRTIRGERRPLDGATGVLAKRVMQEMLTNALRHGVPAGTIRIVELWRDADLVFEIENAVGPANGSGSGLGISGMRTRLSAIGGEVDAQAVESIFTARARIPLAVTFISEDAS